MSIEDYQKQQPSTNFDSPTQQPTFERREDGSYIFSDMKQVAQFLDIQGKTVVGQVFDIGLDGPNLLERELDMYLSQLALFSGADQIVVRNDILPGHADFAKRLSFKSDLLVVDTESVDAKKNDKHPDPLQNEKLQEHISKSTLITPFYTENYTKNALNHKNPEVNPQEISKRANSKSELHTTGREHEVALFDGAVAKNFDEVCTIAQQIDYPLWMKIDGSGSDFVKRISTEQELSQAVQTLMGGLLQGRQAWVEDYKLRNLPVEANILNSLQTKDTIYLNNRQAVFPVPIIMEQDVSKLGKMLHNVCVSGVLSETDFARACISQQVVSENGEWWGSEKANLSPEIVALIDKKIKPLLEYWRSIGYQGPAGPDCIIFETQNGELDLRWIDPNARNPISMVPELIGNKLNLPVWRNSNVTFPENITDFKQVLPLIEEIEAKIPNCKVVPLAFRSTPEEASKVCKMAIFTDNQQSLDDAFKLLSNLVKIGS